MGSQFDESFGNFAAFGGGMLRFIGSLLFVSSLTVQSIMAFPTQPPPAAGIQVSPLIPSPTEHALIVVYDYAENGVLQAVKATNIQLCGRPIRSRLMQRGFRR